MTITASEFDDGIDLVRYGRAITARWLLIFACTAVGLAVGLFFALRAQTVWQSTATLAVVPQVQVASVASPTPPVNAASIRALVNGTLASDAATELGQSGTTITPQQLADAIDVASVPTTSLIKVSVTLADPSAAFRTAAVVSKKAVELSRRIGAADIAVRDTYKAQLDQTSQRLHDAEQQLIAVKAPVPGDLGAADSDSRIANRGLTLEQLRAQLDYDVSRRVYRDVAVQYELARSRVGARSAPLEIIEEAAMPAAPVPSTRVRMILFGTSMGLLAGIALALLVHRN
jgi:capsular polysaccharide biosynthesis protein